MGDEAAKLTRIRSVNLPAGLFDGVPSRMLLAHRRRVGAEELHEQSDNQAHRPVLDALGVIARTLLAGLALAVRDPATAIKAMWATTSGMHRAHFRYVLMDMPGGCRFCPLIAA